LPYIVILLGYLFIRQSANTVAIAGNYSYNLYHFIPNVFGNFFGYWGVFTFGERFFVIYDALRFSLRQNSTIILVVILAISSVIFLARSTYEQKVRKLFKNELTRIMVFSVLFSFVSLLPFLGLGNIAERYGYLASIGFAVFLTALIILVVDSIGKAVSQKRTESYCVIIITLLIILFYFWQHKLIQQDWSKAGSITNKTLVYFRIYHEDIQNNSNLYFANIPIRKGQAWIFPVGLDDGLWFIYRDNTLKIYKLRDLKEAIAAKEINSSNYVFYFDKDGTISEIK